MLPPTLFPIRGFPRLFRRPPFPGIPLPGPAYRVSPPKDDFFPGVPRRLRSPHTSPPFLFLFYVSFRYIRLIVTFPLLPLRAMSSIAAHCFDFAILLMACKGHGPPPLFGVLARKDSTSPFSGLWGLQSGPPPEPFYGSFYPL